MSPAERNARSYFAMSFEESVPFPAPCTWDPRTTNISATGTHYSRFVVHAYRLAEHEHTQPRRVYHRHGIWRCYTTVGCARWLALSRQGPRPRTCGAAESTKPDRRNSHGGRRRHDGFWATGRAVSWRPTRRTSRAKAARLHCRMARVLPWSAESGIRASASTRQSH